MAPWHCYHLPSPSTRGNGPCFLGCHLCWAPRSCLEAAAEQTQGCYSQPGEAAGACSRFGVPARAAVIKGSLCLPLQSCCIIPSPCSSLPRGDQRNIHVGVLLTAVEEGLSIRFFSHPEYTGGKMLLLILDEPIYSQSRKIN